MSASATLFLGLEQNQSPPRTARMPSRSGRPSAE